MTHRHPVRVYFEDTDAGGMAYHASYLRWAERARTEALRDLGLPHAALMARHTALLVVRRLAVEYARPAPLDESLVVETAVLAVGGATVTVAQRVLPAMGTEGPFATLRVGLACLDRITLRPRRIPEPLRAALSPAEGETTTWTAA